MTDPTPEPYWYRRHPRTALVLGLLAVALTLDLTLGTVSHLRLFVRSEPLGDMLRVRRPDLYYHHGLVPNATADSARFGTAVYPIYVNSLGFRDARVRDVPLQRPANVRYRLLFIGDSFTEGLGVPWDSSFVGRVAHALRMDSVEVLNAGMIANSPVLFERKLRMYLSISGLQVDEVAAVADITDLGDEVGYANLSGWDPQAVNPRPRWRRWFGEVMGFSLVYATVRRAWHQHLDEERRVRARREQGIRTADWFEQTYHYRPLTPVGFRLMDEHLEDVRRLLGERHIRMSLTTYPWPTMLSGHQDRDTEWERHWRA